MRLPDLKLIYQTVLWHNSQREHKPGESVGIFIALPEEISKQFPQLKEDSSPAHITVLYCGDLPLSFEETLKQTVIKCCENIKPFTVSLKKPKKFVNDKNQTIFHSPVKSSKLDNFHETLKKALLINQVPVSNKFPEFKPHCTIEYVEEGQEPKYGDIVPVGEWEVNSCWIWGASQPYLVGLGK